MSRTWGQYRGEEIIGRGRYGEVWRCRDTTGGGYVSLMNLPAPSDFPGPAGKEYATRFLEESQAAQRVQHPNVVRVLDSGTSAEGFPYIVTEVVEATNYYQVIQAEGPLAGDKAARVGESLARALAAAHAKFVIHGSVDPLVALCLSDGSTRLDGFGVASAATVLTPPSAPFESPEQTAGGLIRPESDIFSLGVTMYALVTATHPFERGSTAESRRSIVHDEPPPPSSVRPELQGRWDELLARAMAKEPAARFESAAMLATAFSALLSPDDSSTKTIERPNLAPKLEVVVVDGPDKDMRVDLATSVVIGRESGDLPLRDATVSRNHCTVSLIDDHIHIDDHGSRNGTWLAGTKVTSSQIKVGTIFAVGSYTKLRVLRKET